MGKISGAGLDPFLALCVIYIFRCPNISKEIYIKGNISDIYEEEIDADTIHTILKMANYRLLKLENECALCIDVLLETLHYSKYC